MLTVLGLVILLVQQQGWFRGAVQSAKTSQPGLYGVVQFSDGDTIVVDMNGKHETVRFIGVDTPETHDPRKAVQCFGQAAADFTKDLIGQNDVRLEADPQGTNRDRYNRLLRYIYLPDGRLVNAEIIKQGYGFAYLSFPFTKSEEFRFYQNEAMQANRGLWGSCQPVKNDYGGYTSNNAQ
jgi:micrococcal nuclease